MTWFHSGFAFFSIILVHNFKKNDNNIKIANDLGHF